MTNVELVDGLPKLSPITVRPRLLIIGGPDDALAEVALTIPLDLESKLEPESELERARRRAPLTQE